MKAVLAHWSDNKNKHLPPLVVITPAIRIDSLQVVAVNMCWPLA
jgi:hypothetical protein